MPPPPQRFVDEGYLWNSGNFIFRADVMLGELKKFEPDMAAAAAGAVEKAKADLGFLLLDAESFAQAPKKSIDYAVMERTDKAAVIGADVGWSDVGLWTTVWRLSERDADGNSLRGKAVAMDAHNILVRTDDQLTAVVGLDNVIVVTTPDAVLVVDAGHADKVKHLVDRLKAEKRPEASEHKRAYRPWGYYQSVDRRRALSGQAHCREAGRHGYPCRSIFIAPNIGSSCAARRRSSATVKTHHVHENELIYLPIGCEHRLTNPGKINLELIEVQTGSYLGEDDIIRIEDVYNRG